MAKETFKGLYDCELEEFWRMYYSGQYYLKEIAEWFGISVYEVNKYIKEGRTRGRH